MPEVKFEVAEGDSLDQSVLKRLLQNPDTHVLNTAQRDAVNNMPADLASALASKADKAAVTAKSDKSYVDEELAKKANASSLGQKADRDDLNALATKQELQAGLNNKLDQLHLGSAGMADVEDFATAAQGAKADRAIQSNPDNVGIALLNIVAMTRAQYDSLANPLTGTAYVITDQGTIIVGTHVSAEITRTAEEVPTQRRTDTSIIKLFGHDGLLTGGTNMSATKVAGDAPLTVSADGLVILTDDTAAAGDYSITVEITADDASPKQFTFTVTVLPYITGDVSGDTVSITTSEETVTITSDAEPWGNVSAEIPITDVVEESGPYVPIDFPAQIYDGYFWHIALTNHATITRNYTWYDGVGQTGNVIEGADTAEAPVGALSARLELDDNVDGAVMLKANVPSTVEEPVTSGWTPAEYSGDTRMWLDPHDETSLTMDGDTVTQINDKSGYVNTDGDPMHATRWKGAYGDTGPTIAANGMLNFGEGQSLSNPPNEVTGATPRTLIMAIGSIANKEANRALFTTGYGGEGTAWRITADNSFGFRFEWNGSGNSFGAGSSINDAAILVVQHDGSDTFAGTLAALNGAALEPITTSDTPIATTRDQQILSLADDPGELGGPIGTVLYTADNPSQADLDKLVGYVAHRNGLESLLPTDHPYKSTAPQK